MVLSVGRMNSVIMSILVHNEQAIQNMSKGKRLLVEQHECHKILMRCLCPWYSERIGHRVVVQELNHLGSWLKMGLPF